MITLIYPYPLCPIATGMKHSKLANSSVKMVSPSPRCHITFGDCRTVRSMARHGEKSGGVWDEENVEATYKTTPDKESPLWNIHSQVIYWWTATEVNEEHAYIIVYDGKVWSRAKQISPAYLGIRCFKQP